MSQDIAFDAAISFAGEQRPLARSIARQLTPLGYSFFYDGYNTAELWGADLSVFFGKIYGRVKYVLMIVSKEYVEKAWTNHERRFAIENVLSHDDHRILQLKVDSLAVPGIPAVFGHFPYNGNVNEVCGALAKIIGPKEQIPIEGDGLVVQKIIEICSRRSIFTSMDQEISTDKMFKSIVSCIAKLHKLLATVRNAPISQPIKSIIRDLNSIDKFSKDAPSGIYMFNPLAKAELNFFKLQIIDTLHGLNYKYRLGLDLPDDIGYDYELRAAYRSMTD